LLGRHELRTVDGEERPGGGHGFVVRLATYRYYNMDQVVAQALTLYTKLTGSMNVGRVGGSEVYFSETDFELVQLFAAQASVALALSWVLTCIYYGACLRRTPCCFKL